MHPVILSVEAFLAPSHKDKERGMDQDIQFTFEGILYYVSAEAYDIGKIILPDGRMLQVDVWLESSPPKPKELHEVKHEFMGMDVVRIANKLEAVLATMQDPD